MAVNQFAVAQRAPEPPSGRVTLVSLRGDDTQTFLTPPEDQDRTGGVGGWETSARPLRREAHYYAGGPTNDARSLPLLWDLSAQAPGRTIEQRLDALYRMGQAVGDEDEPPGIVLLGDVPAPDKRIVWKLDEVSLGAMRFWPTNPRALMSLRVTLSLSRLTKAEEVERVTVRSTRGKSGKRRQRTIRTRRGDTLRGLAVRYLGGAGQWTKIRGWNPRLKRTDPDVPMRANVKVTLK